MQSSPRRRPATPRWRWLAALALAASVALIGWLARPRASAWPTRPAGPSPTNAAPLYTTSIDVADVVPYQVLTDQRTEKDGRRVIRRLILLAHDADRKQVRATLFKALQELLRDEGTSLDLAFLWALPSRGLLKPGVYDDLLSIVCGRLYHIADGKGLDGQTKGILTTAVTDILIDDRPPSRADLELVVAAAGAVVDRRAAGSKDDQAKMLQRFAAQRGIPYERLVKAMQHVLAHYPMLVKELLAPGAG